MYDELTAEREKSISINMPGLMKDVYAWMAIALVVTGFSAWFVADNALLRGLFMGSRTGTLVLIVATFALVWRLSSAMGKMSLKTAAAMFLVYSVLNGITLSAVFLTYTLSSIGGVFFMTAGTFGIMSVYGYVTKADLSKLGNMCLMGLFGIILATVVGFFFDSTLLQMLISYAGILIFTGLTIYDTQSIKRLALTYHSRATDEGQKIAIMGALTLYLDFINIFIYLLRLFGEKKEGHQKSVELRFHAFLMSLFGVNDRRQPAAPVISTGAKWSGEISLRNGTSNIVAGDFWAQSINRK